MPCGDVDVRSRVAPDLDDGRAILLEVLLGIVRRQRRLAEHVKRIAIGALTRALRALKRLLDIAAHHELMAEDAHRLTQRSACHGLAETTREPPEPGADRAELGAIHIDDA